MTRSANVGGLQDGETRTVWTDTDESRNKNIWAPEMHLIDGVFVSSEFPHKDILISFLVGTSSIQLAMET